MLKAFIAVMLCLPVYFQTTQAAGNQALMDKARKKAFLLNQQIIDRLDRLDVDGKVSFSGHIIRDPNGQLQISIEDMQVQPLSQGSSEISAWKTLKHDYIRYMPFESMIEPERLKSAQPPTGFYGGGAAQ